MLRRQNGVGNYLYRMMLSLQHRGLDSSGVIIYADRGLTPDEYVLMVSVIDVPGALGEVGNAIGAAGGDIRDIHVGGSKHGGYGLNSYRVKISEPATIDDVVSSINKTKVGTVYSFGKRAQLIKDVGTVRDLEESFNVSALHGTHGMAHVRFSTESRVDPHHAHPFHTDAFPDIAVVHNGQITNYYNVRRRLERRGYKLKTGNDTECIVFYIVDRVREGESLEDALAASVDELDGPFSYIISTPSGLGIARDKLGLRPMMFTQDRNGYYVASEECALLEVSAVTKPRVLRPGEVRVFERSDD